MNSSDAQYASPNHDPESTTNEATPDGHNHRWRIEEQGTARSQGTCWCGASRLFFNGWNDERDGWHGNVGGRARNHK